MRPAIEPSRLRGTPWSPEKAAAVARNYAQFCEMARVFGDDVAAELIHPAAGREGQILAQGEGWTIRHRIIGPL